MNFNSLAFLIYFARRGGALLGPALQGPEILAPGSLVLFLYVLEPGVPLFAALFHGGGLLLRPGHRSQPGKKGPVPVFPGCSLCMNLGLLFFFKYFDFFAGSINDLCALWAFPTGFPGWG